jgi:hypothetical protein
MTTLHKFASVHSHVHNHFNHESHLIDGQTYESRRAVALAEWQCRLPPEPGSIQDQRVNLVRGTIRLTAPFDRQ